MTSNSNEQRDGQKSEKTRQIIQAENSNSSGLHTASGRVSEFIQNFLTLSETPPRFVKTQFGVQHVEVLNMSTTLTLDVHNKTIIINSESRANIPPLPLLSND